MKTKLIVLVSLLVVVSAIAGWVGWGSWGGSLSSSQSNKNFANSNFSLKPQEALAQGTERTIVFQNGAIVNVNP